MTRDEAYSLAIRMQRVAGNINPERDGYLQVDTLVALGVLKLDEPKSVEQRFDDVACCYVTMPQEAQGMRNMLAKAGLKIVDASCPE